MKRNILIFLTVLVLAVAALANPSFNPVPGSGSTISNQTNTPSDNIATITVNGDGTITVTEQDGETVNMTYNPVTGEYNGTTIRDEAVVLRLWFCPDCGQNLYNYVRGIFVMDDGHFYPWPE